jgi:glycosyltransferase involved in cell wall biosynthesis
LRLKIAAKVDRVDQSYFDDVIRPLIDHPLVEFIGEIGEHEKAAFLSEALGLLFPVDWPEPFGLVMIEAMACGTPVVAYRRGSVPEVIEGGLTGFVVDDIEGAINSVQRLEQLDRARIRMRFEQRFTARRMANDYVSLYAAQTRVVELPRTSSHLTYGSEQPKPGIDGDQEKPATAA